MAAIAAALGEDLIALAAVFYPPRFGPPGSAGRSRSAASGNPRSDRHRRCTLGRMVAGAVFYAMAVPVLAAGLAVLVLDRGYGTRRAEPASEAVGEATGAV
jgi:hypothetical protein